MPRKQETNKNKRKKQKTAGAEHRVEEKSTRVGDINGSTGVAIGTNARAVVIQLKSLFDFDRIFVFARDHWIFITANILLFGPAAMAWFYFRDRFQISTSTFVLGAFFLEACLVFFYLITQKITWKTTSIVLSLIALLGLAGVMTREYTRAVYPTRIDKNKFGIAIAYFGEGSNFKRTALSSEVSDSVFKRLRQQIVENQELNKFVEIKQIGVVKTREEAIEEGQRHAADLVIWGQLLSNEEVTSISFEVLESDHVSNPNFPRIIPLFKHSISDTLFIPGRSSEEIAGATTTISGFVFGTAHLFSWDFPPAQNAFREAIDSSKLHSESDLYLLYFYYGLSLQWAGDLELADEQFLLASEIRPDDPATYLAMAYGNRSLGNHELAVTQAGRAFESINQHLKQNTDNAYAFYDRALARVIFEDWELALQDYQAALQIEPDFYIAYIGLIRTLLEMDRFSDAIQASKEALKLAEEINISPEWAHLYLAESYANNNDIQQARVNYEKAVLFGSHIDWLHYQAGQFYLDHGDYSAALKEYEAMLDVTNNKAWAYATIGEFYKEIDVFDLALENYQFASQFNPEDDGIWISLANVYARLEMYEKADDAFRRAIENAERPGNLVYTRTLFGNFLYLQEKYEEAILQWEDALRLEPDRCDLMLNLGLAYEELEQLDQARGIYLSALAGGESTEFDCESDVRSRLDDLLP